MSVCVCVYAFLQVKSVNRALKLLHGHPALWVE